MILPALLFNTCFRAAYIYYLIPDYPRGEVTRARTLENEQMRTRHTHTHADGMRSIYYYYYYNVQNGF